MDLCEFKASLVYRASFRTVGVTQKNPVLGKKNPKTKKRPTPTKINTKNKKGKKEGNSKGIERFRAFYPGIITVPST